MRTRRWIIYCCAAILISCNRTAPQIPSQRKSASPQPDSAQLALMAFNQGMTESADEQLASIAQTDSLPFALYERGTWCAILSPGEGETVHRGEECSLHIRTYSLSGKLYTDFVQTARIGTWQLPAAIEANITEWHHGARLVLLAPWYAAYGIQGTEHIPPYENLRIEITIQ